VESADAVTYDPGPAAVPAARRFVRDTLKSWQLPGGDDLLADAELLTSELVTNAVVHARTRVQVSCRVDGSEVEVSVLDWQPGRQLHGSSEPEMDAGRVTGRGLLLAAALSSSWGVTYAPVAKTVWFRLPKSRAAPSASPVCTGPAAGHNAHRAPPGHARFANGRPGGAHISFLAEASDLLAGTMDQQQTIALGAQLVVPRLADWCAVLLADARGQLTLAHVWHADENRNDALRRVLSRAPLPTVNRGTWQQWSIPVPNPEAGVSGMAELATGPVWCFPMLARSRSLGILALGRPNGALGWPTAELATDLARRVALALDNAGLYSAQLRASHALQRSLLPPQLPDIPGLDIAAGYQPAGEGDEVGGDFYDVFQVAQDRWRFAIGDVCGKGMEAASVTGLTRHALRILAREGHDVPDVVARLNSIILEEDTAVPFLTLIHGEIVNMPGHAALSLVCAGHPPPLLLRPAASPRAAATSQRLIGVIDGARFRADTCALWPGDLLLCVTDGVTERRAGSRLLGEGNGLQKLLRDCAGLSAGAVVARIQREVAGYGSDPAADDTALLVFRGTSVT
jgi:serine phosphatase RsbU (regulator of sigma subunit)/anti-sigma regulatory factor (Ser/Thr protein kinase)